MTGMAHLFHPTFSKRADGIQQWPERQIQLLAPFANRRSNCLLPRAEVATVFFRKTLLHTKRSPELVLMAEDDDAYHHFYYYAAGGRIGDVTTDRNDRFRKSYVEELAIEIKDRREPSLYA